MKKSAKNLKDQSYYWVRREPSSGESGAATYPNWEPMLWDAATAHFHCRGDRTAYAPEDLVGIGEIIERRPRRVTRKGYVATTIDFENKRANPAYDEVFNSLRSAAKAGTGLPIPVEISWAAEDAALATAFAKSLKTPPPHVGTRYCL